MNIKQLRESKLMSRYRLAKEMGVAYQTVTFWEEGRYKPNAENVKKLEEIFGLPDVKTVLPIKTVSSTTK